MNTIKVVKDRIIKGAMVMNGYRVFIEGHKETYEVASTYTEAIGKLIITLSGEMGIEVDFSEVQENVQ